MPTLLTNNKNSYISIKLPDHIRDQLYDYAIQVSQIDKKFKIMNKESLHMTFIFLGSNKKYKEIEQINNVMETFNSNYEFESGNTDWFPPAKQNLLVIKFEASKLVNEIREQLMRQLNMKLDNFVPHVTLGKRNNYSQNKAKVGDKKATKNLPELRKMNFISDELILHNPYF